MTAEFFGLPGSGKTTLIGSLTWEENSVFLKKRRGKNISKISHFRNALTPEFLSFSLHCGLLVLSKKEKAKEDWGFVRSMMRLYLIYMWERDCGERGYHCYDHGFIQFFSSLVWTEYHTRDRALRLAEQFCRNMNGSVKLVYLQSENYEEIYERMVNRGEFRRILQLLDREKAMELLKFQNDFFNDVYAMAEEYGMVIRLDAMDTIQNNMDALQAEMRG